MSLEVNSNTNLSFDQISTPGGILNGITSVCKTCSPMSPIGFELSIWWRNPVCTKKVRTVDHFILRVSRRGEKKESTQLDSGIFFFKWNQIHFYLWETALRSEVVRLCSLRSPRLDDEQSRPVLFVDEISLSLSDVTVRSNLDIVSFSHSNWIRESTAHGALFQVAVHEVLGLRFSPFCVTWKKSVTLRGRWLNKGKMVTVCWPYRGDSFATEAVFLMNEQMPISWLKS